MGGIYLRFTITMATSSQEIPRWNVAYLLFSALEKLTTFSSTLGKRVSSEHNDCQSKEERKGASLQVTERKKETLSLPDTNHCKASISSDGAFTGNRRTSHVSQRWKWVHGSPAQGAFRSWSDGQADGALLERSEELRSAVEEQEMRVVEGPGLGRRSRSGMHELSSRVWYGDYSE